MRNITIISKELKCVFLHIPKTGETSIEKYWGRFESLEGDFDMAAAHLKIDDSKLPNLLVWDYEYYTNFYNEVTKDLVDKLYKVKIDYFNFEYRE